MTGGGCCTLSAHKLTGQLHLSAAAGMRMRVQLTGADATAAPFAGCVRCRGLSAEEKAYLRGRFLQLIPQDDNQVGFALSCRSHRTEC